MDMLEEIATRTGWKTTEWQDNGGILHAPNRSASVYRRGEVYDVYLHGKTNGIVPTKTMNNMDEVVEYLNAIA